ncbi:MAG: hypothetical protein EVB11_05230 [Winogradskyella sp.]|nr:MAG: hypothetical protein EVB11_05230 [Winogradskyella sp.]
MDKFFSRIILKRTILLLIVLFFLMQLYRPNKNDSNYIAANDFLEISVAPTDIKTLIRNSCYDCHSNRTNYKWYDNIAPLSWWIDKTVEKGKVAINFSEWENTDAQKRLSFLSASVFDIKTDRMPTTDYLKLHPSAKLSNKEKMKIISWINNIDRFNPYYEINEH